MSHIYVNTKKQAIEFSNTVLFIMLYIYSFLGTSGQNVDDILKYTDFDDPIVMAERCLFWRHIAPSAPDTLCMFFLLLSFLDPEKKQKGKVVYG